LSFRFLNNFPASSAILNLRIDKQFRDRKEELEKMGGMEKLRKQANDRKTRNEYPALKHCLA
jgi:hypothetical protein